MAYLSSLTCLAHRCHGPWQHFQRVFSVVFQVWTEPRTWSRPTIFRVYLLAWAQMIPLLRKFDVPSIFATRNIRRQKRLSNTKNVDISQISPFSSRPPNDCKSLRKAFPQLPLSPRKIICRTTSTRSEETTPRRTALNFVAGLHSFWSSTNDKYADKSNS